MKKQITAALSVALLAALAACGAAPTAADADAAPAAEWQASQQDTTGRVPNMMHRPGPNPPASGGEVRDSAGRMIAKRAVISGCRLLPLREDSWDDRGQIRARSPPSREAPVKKQIAAVFAAAALVTLAACGAAPTHSDAAPTTEWQANVTAEQDTTGRVPNLFGSGN